MGHHNEWATFLPYATSQPQHELLPQPEMESLPNESRMILTLEALKKDPKLSIRQAATIFTIPRSSLQRRRAGQQPRYEIPANLRKLTDLEEKVLLERVLDLDARGFQPRLPDIREMADRLRAARDAPRVGPR